MSVVIEIPGSAQVCPETEEQGKAFAEHLESLVKQDADRWRLIVARHEGFRRWCRVKLAQLLRRVTVRLDP